MFKQLCLLLLLLVAVSSSEVTPKVSTDITEYIEIVKCFLNQENLINDVVSLVDIIKSGEYDKLLSLSFKLYSDGSAAVKECITKEEINLEAINTNIGLNDHSIPKNLCEKTCRDMYLGIQLTLCLASCYY